MSRLDHMKNLWDHAQTELDLPALEKATAVWRSAAEAEKLELESSNLKRTIHSESARFWVPVMATIISSAALVGTLLFQISQFKENTRLQTEAAEDAQYREALKSIQSPEMIHGAVGMPLLKSFLDSPRYGKQAREVASKFMRGIVDYASFESLFDPIANKTDWSNYRDVVTLEAVLFERWRRYRDDLDRMEKYQEATQKRLGPPGPGRNDISSLGTEPVMRRGPGPQVTLTEVKIYKEQVEKELLRCEDFLVQVLRRARPRGLNVDLSGPSAVYLGNKDIGGVDLKGAVLKEVVFDSSQLDGSDLSDVTDFDQSSWDNVAWWRANKISLPLLKYLKDNYAYSPKATYEKPATLDEYNKQLAKLE